MSKKRTGHRAPQPDPRPAQRGQAPGKPVNNARPELIPWLLVKVFNGPPWMEMMVDPKLLPPGMDTQGLANDLVRCIQARYQQIEDSKTKMVENDEMKVSGVPYSVPNPQPDPNQAEAQTEADPPPPTDKPEYPH